jgi:RNA polymerase sigma-70 factor (ECF subfamily)
VGVEQPPAEKPPFDVVYPEIARQVRKLVRRLRMAHGDDLEDVVEHALLAVAEAWPQYATERPLVAWIAAIVRRVALPALDPGEAAPPEETLGHEGLIPKESAVVDERHALLLELLRPMDEDVRIVFILKEIDGFTMSEAAEMLGVPLAAAYSRLRVAWDELEGRMTERKGRLEAGGVAAWLGAPAEAARRRMSFS